MTVIGHRSPPNSFSNAYIWIPNVHDIYPTISTCQCPISIFTPDWTLDIVKQQLDDPMMCNVCVPWADSSCQTHCNCF